MAARPKRTTTKADTEAEKPDTEARKTDAETGKPDTEEEAAAATADPYSSAPLPRSPFTQSLEAQRPPAREEG